nr:hypothetical protein [uncultured Aminipila sp.]
MDYLRKSVINSDAYKNIGSDNFKESSTDTNLKNNAQNADSKSTTQDADSKKRML